MVKYTTWMTSRDESESYYQIFVGSLDGKTGTDDDVDAFRHAYVSAV